MRYLSMLSLFVSLIFAFHRFPGERRSLACHRRNFNSIKSLQILHDSDHGEYLFLPRWFAGRSRGSGNVSPNLIPPVYSLSTCFPPVAKATGDETIIGEVGNYRMTPLGVCSRLWCRAWHEFEMLLLMQGCPRSDCRMYTWGAPESHSVSVFI